MVVSIVVLTFEQMEVCVCVRACVFLVTMRREEKSPHNTFWKSCLVFGWTGWFWLICKRGKLFCFSDWSVWVLIPNARWFIFVVLGRVRSLGLWTREVLFSIAVVSVAKRYAGKSFENVSLFAKHRTILKQKSLFNYQLRIYINFTLSLWKFSIFYNVWRNELLKF